VESHTDRQSQRADEKIPNTHAHNFLTSQEEQKKRENINGKIFSLTSAHFFMFPNVSFYVEAILPLECDIKRNDNHRRHVTISVDET
jgi:hypothetical protein